MGFQKLFIWHLNFKCSLDPLFQGQEKVLLLSQKFVQYNIFFLNDVTLQSCSQSNSVFLNSLENMS